MTHEKYWDILKGLGIIAIVIGHSGSPLQRIVYMYHIQLFFFISGYLYNDAYSRDPGVYIIKKTRSLYLPFLKYSLIFLFLHNVLLRINFLTLSSEPGFIAVKKYAWIDFLKMAEDIVMLRDTEQLTGPMWFVLMLIACGLMYCLIRYCSVKFGGRYSLLLTGIMAMVLYAFGMVLADQKFVLSLHADKAFVLIPIFFAGAMVRQFRVKVPLHWTMALLSLILLAFLSSRYGFIELANQKYLGPWLFIAASSAGIYMNLYLGKSIEKTPYMSDMIARIGRESFAIMALHLAAFKIANGVYIMANKLPAFMQARYPVITGEGLWWVLNTVIGVGLPVLIVGSFSYLYELYNRKRVAGTAV